MTTTVWQMARRPRWIAALVLCLAIAGGFAALSQWQLDRAVSTGAVEGTVSSETTVPLDSVVQPAQAVPELAIGQRVSVEAEAIATDYRVLGGRYNDGDEGYWVIGHLRTALADGSAADLPVAIGWTSDETTAEAVAAEYRAVDPGTATYTGRFVSTEAPELPEDGEPAETVTTMSTAALVNEWTDVAPYVYLGFVVSDAPADGLAPIAAPVPDRGVELNWLNIFYAIEWVVFAGFALYLWFRLVKDAQEREAEDAEEAEEAAAVERAAAEARNTRLISG